MLISEKELRNAEEWFQKRGEITILIGRMMPAVRTVISLPAGIFRMHITKFVVFTVIGSIPWNIILAYFGYILGIHWMMILNYSVYIDIIGILALVVLIVIMFIRIKH